MNSCMQNAFHHEMKDGEHVCKHIDLSKRNRVLFVFYAGLAFCTARSCRWIFLGFSQDSLHSGTCMSNLSNSNRVRAINGNTNIAKKCKYIQKQHMQYEYTTTPLLHYTSTPLHLPITLTQYELSTRQCAKTHRA
jgi:hypothetical protein